MPPPPVLRERLVAVLLAAGFPHYDDTLPTYSSGGVFSVFGGEGALVYVHWWDSAPDERRVRLGEFARALEAAGFRVEDRGDRLYVPEDDA